MGHSEQYTLNEQEALSRLLLVTRLLSADMRHGLESMGLTEARAQLLWELGQQAPLTQKTLADRLKVTPRNITTLVDALEQTGFVRRDAHPTDRRAVAVGLTAKGQTRVQDLRRDFARLADDLFGALSQAELATFAEILARSARHLETLAEDHTRRD